MTGVPPSGAGARGAPGASAVPAPWRCARTLMPARTGVMQARWPPRPSTFTRHSKHAPMPQ